MNDRELDLMLRRAAAPRAAGVHTSIGAAIMARVRGDDGRARRWRVLACWLLGLATLAALATAGAIGYSRASLDAVHDVPPLMPLFHEPLTR